MILFRRVWFERQIVRIAPRNSQEPNSRLTRLVCLPCQPRPARWASGFSISGAVSTNTLTCAPAVFREHACERFQPGFDDVVIIAPLGVSADLAFALARQPFQRLARRRVIDAEHDRAFRLRPQRLRTRAAVRGGGHPFHLAVAVKVEEFVSRAPAGHGASARATPIA